MDEAQNWVERYFEGTLTEEELVTFKERVNSDPVWKSTFEIETDIVDGIEAFTNKKLKSRLQEIHQEEITTSNVQTTPHVSSIKWWITAAIVIGLLIIYLWWQSRPSPEKLYQAYFAFEIDLNEKGSKETSLLSAQQYLKNSDFDNVLIALDEYLINHPTDREVQLIKGTILLEKTDNEAAFSIFQQIAQSNSAFKQDAIWYGALALIRNNQLVEAIIQLEQIPTTSNRYNQAQQLIQEVKALLPQKR